MGKYFIDIYEFTIHVYKGGLCYDEEHNKELSKQVIFAYIELINGGRYENQESCFLNKSILELWEDKNSWFAKSSNLKIKDKDLFIRTENIDICIYRCEFVCITCGQHFASNKELATHLEEHNKMICSWCQYEFKEYAEFLTHTLTFCKRPICTKRV